MKWQNLVTCPGDMLAVEGLQPPILESTDDLVTGADTNKLQIQNKRQRHKLQDEQTPTPWWTKHTGDSIHPPNQERHTKYRNELCPAGTPHTLQASCWQSGPNWDALPKQANRGRRMRCGKQWLEGLTSPLDHPRHLHTFPKKA